MARRGTFIVIEGTDGSGKGTQFKLLHERLQAAGYDVETFDFPQYNQPSSYFVRQYLEGIYGNAESIGAYTASLFYALDRYEASAKIRAALDAGKIVISNRYTGSSMGHQGGKFASSEQRRGFFIWLDNLEFEMLRIPRPDVNFVLRVPAEVAEELIEKRGVHPGSGKKRDVHEADFKHLERSVVTYDDLCRLFPKDFQRIDCVRAGKLLGVEDIQRMLWEKISPLLPTPPQLEMPMPGARPQQAAAPSLAVQFGRTARELDSEAAWHTASFRNAGERPKPQTEAALVADNPPDDPYITGPGAVYAFTDALPPALVAAIMSTLARSSGIFSATVLKAFHDAATKDKTFVKRVIGTYGDASVRRLVSQQVMITGASAVLAQKLNWSRLVSCTTTQPSYLRPELKDTAGNYKYITPPGVTAAVKLAYQEHMDRIYSRYAAMLPQLIQHLQDESTTPAHGRNTDWKASIEAQARAVLFDVLPVANTSTVGVYATADGFEKLIVRLLGDVSPEAQRTGARIVQELRKTIPAFMEDTDRPDRGGAEIVYRATNRRAIEQLTRTHVAETYAPQTDTVQLTDVWPRNELDLTADILYAYTNLPLPTLRQTVTGWPIARKLETFDAYVGERLNRREFPGRVFEKAHYSWDLVTPFTVFRELAQLRIVDDLEWQALTPRGGYEVPQVIEDAGLADDYEDCFDISLELHSLLQQNGYELEAQYATLAGHRLRWKMTLNARQAFRFFEEHTGQQATPQTRQIVERMYDRLHEVHPTIAGAMQFVGQPEDPELNQLAAERYEQFHTGQQ